MRRPAFARSAPARLAGARTEVAGVRRRPAEVVLITGASAGVGRATALAFARRGAHIGLLARGRERLEQTKRESQLPSAATRSVDRGKAALA